MWCCNLVNVCRRLGITWCRLEDEGRLCLYPEGVWFESWLGHWRCFDLPNQMYCSIYLFIFMQSVFLDTPRSKPEGSCDLDSAVSYFKSLGFKSRLGDRIIWCLFHGFSQHLHLNAKVVPVIMLYLEYAGIQFLGSGGKCLQEYPKEWSPVP